MPICIWSSVEPCFGIVSACLPNMIYLFRKIIAFWTPSSKNNTSAGSTGSVVRMLPRSGARKEVNRGQFVQLDEDLPRFAKIHDNTVPAYKVEGYGQEREISHGTIHVKKDFDLNYV